MNEKEQRMNAFLVRAFHHLLKAEEQMIASSRFPDLSFREVHVIEAVVNQEADETANTAAKLAGTLGVTAGTLTASVSLLEKKGYLLRKRSEADKRVVRIYATEKAHTAHRIHMLFHRRMVREIMKILSENEQDTLICALDTIEEYMNIHH